MQKIILIAVLFLTPVSWSKEKCSTAKWPFSHKIERFTGDDLKSFNRKHLFSYLYFELTAENKSRIPKLAPLLMRFLTKTELKDDRYRMLQTMDWMAELNSSNPNVLLLKDICFLHQAVEGLQK